MIENLGNRIADIGTIVDVISTSPSKRRCSRSTPRSSLRRWASDRQHRSMTELKEALGALKRQSEILQTEVKRFRLQ